MKLMSGQHYLGFMEDMHRALRPAWYLEIGTQTGLSLAISQTRSIAVDPAFRLSREVIGAKPEVHFFQETSDDFFAAGHLERLGASVNLAFLDGMHRYEFLLRDFIGIERQMSAEGIVLLHDCVPWSVGMTARNQEDSPTAAWTGDVWKVVPILQKYRPDLEIHIYDCAPTGLVVVSGLDPKSAVLQKNYDRILAEFDGVDSVEETVGAFEVIRASKSPWGRRQARPRTNKLSFAIQLPVPRPYGQSGWGDYHFGVGLAEALRRRGCEARVQTVKQWNQVEDEDEIDLVIRGVAPYQPRSGHRLLYWLISQDGSGLEKELSEADHVFAAGKPMAEALMGKLGAGKVSLLPQAFDPKRMRPPDPAAPRRGILFVGIARRFERPMITHALATGTELELWGSGWQHRATAPWHRGMRIANEDLGRFYGDAEIVLNDHTPAMRAAGLTSNRIFDALACATPVISDPVVWLPEDLRDFVEVVSTPDEFRAAIDRIRSEGAAKRNARRELAEQMRTTHSFDARADSILETVRALYG